eukprot:INCI9555.1.p1 GENE.INCI9555.1~~INCI9555.1.p1  ORF type:complete len:827 (-),score=205.09 INCI9555.1:1027-3426(-)
MADLSAAQLSDEEAAAAAAEEGLDEAQKQSHDDNIEDEGVHENVAAAAAAAAPAALECANVVDADAKQFLDQFEKTRNELQGDDREKESAVIEDVDEQRSRDGADEEEQRDANSESDNESVGSGLERNSAHSRSRHSSYSFKDGKRQGEDPEEVAVADGDEHRRKHVVESGANRDDSAKKDVVDNANADSQAIDPSFEQQPLAVDERNRDELNGTLPDHPRENANEHCTETAGHGELTAVDEDSGVEDEGTPNRTTQVDRIAEPKKPVSETSQERQLNDEDAQSSCRLDRERDNQETERCDGQRNDAEITQKGGGEPGEKESPIAPGAQCGEGENVLKRDLETEHADKQGITAFDSKQANANESGTSGKSCFEKYNDDDEVPPPPPPHLPSPRNSGDELSDSAVDLADGPLPPASPRSQEDGGHDAHDDSFNSDCPPPPPSSGSKSESDSSDENEVEHESNAPAEWTFDNAVNVKDSDSVDGDDAVDGLCREQDTGVADHESDSDACTEVEATAKQDMGSVDVVVFEGLGTVVDSVSLSAAVDAVRTSVDGHCQSKSTNESQELVLQVRHRRHDLMEDPVGAIDRLLDMAKAIRQSASFLPIEFEDGTLHPAMNTENSATPELDDNNILVTVEAANEGESFVDDDDDVILSSHRRLPQSFSPPASFLEKLRSAHTHGSGRQQQVQSPLLPQQNGRFGCIAGPLVAAGNRPRLENDSRQYNDDDEVLVAHGHGVVVTGCHDGTAIEQATQGPLQAGFRKNEATADSQVPVITQGVDSGNAWNLRHAFLHSFRRASLSPQR